MVLDRFLTLWAGLISDEDWLGFPPWLISVH
jgi:hypothetical protein